MNIMGIVTKNILWILFKQSKQYHKTSYRYYANNPNYIMKQLMDSVRTIQTTSWNIFWIVWEPRQCYRICHGYCGKSLRNIIKYNGYCRTNLIKYCRPCYEYCRNNTNNTMKYLMNVIETIKIIISFLKNLRCFYFSFIILFFSFFFNHQILYSHFRINFRTIDDNICDMLLLYN